MKLFRCLLAFGLSVACLTGASQARAEAATRGVFQIGVGFRYGIDQNEGDVNPWGTGLGLDLGYTMENSFYLGGNFDYFFGETVTVGTSEIDYGVWQLSAEGGYDVGLGKSVVIRPKLGIGVGSLQVDGCVVGVCADRADKDFLLAPGATFLVLTRSFSMSVDARYAMLFTDPELSKAVILSLGIGF